MNKAAKPAGLKNNSTNWSSILISNVLIRVANEKRLLIITAFKLTPFEWCFNFNLLTSLQNFILLVTTLYSFHNNTAGN